MIQTRIAATAKRLASDKKLRISLVGPCITFILWPVHLIFKGHDGLAHGLMTLLNVYGPAVVFTKEYRYVKKQLLPTYESLHDICDRLGFQCTARVGQLKWTLRLGILLLSISIGLGIATVFTSHQIAFQLLALASQMGVLWAAFQLSRQLTTTINLAGPIIERIRKGDFPREIEPPSSATFILLLLPARLREPLVGDLEEKYRTSVLPKYGLRRARFWYWEQVLISLYPVLWAQVRRFAALAALWRHIS